MKTPNKNTILQGAGQFGISLMLYTMLVGWRSCDCAVSPSAVCAGNQYAVFHPYIFLWLLGLNVAAIVVIEIIRREME